MIKYNNTKKIFNQSNKYSKIKKIKKIKKNLTNKF